jgi:K+-sensing histidine kinase KdpD
LYFSVNDNGIGIKKKNKIHIFKIFNAFKDEKRQINTKGIGLGLCISKMIVNKFQGEIDFRSKYKKGSLFWFTFKIDSRESKI